jgi:uncharacterized protein
VTLYRILSLDGGGIRGLLTAVLLERLEEARPGFLARFDLFAGTSTGGILALGLAAGLSPSQLASLYEEKGAFVFERGLWRRLLGLFYAFRPKYANANLEQTLLEWLGEDRLDDFLPRHVLIAAFDLDNEGRSLGTRSWKPKFFHNYPGADSDGHERAVDVALRTSAAPVYFPIVQGYIDGGIVANNPSMAALAQVIDGRHAGQSPDNVALLSLGTGHLPKFLPVHDGEWGWIQWIKDLRLLQLILEGTASVADYQCRQLLGSRYHRLDPNLPYPIELDHVHRIPDLRRLALQVDLDASLRWLDEH